jgi:hypothetical protein
MRQGLSDVVAHLRNESETAPDEDIENFVRYTNSLDKARGQDIRVSLPELFERWTEERPWDLDAVERYRSESVKSDAVAGSLALNKRGNARRLLARISRFIQKISPRLALFMRLK